MFESIKNLAVIAIKWGSIADALDRNFTKAAESFTAMTTAIAGKAASSHTHAQSDITGLTAALGGKAASSHTHAQSDITGLTAALEALDARIKALEPYDVSIVTSVSPTLPDGDSTFTITTSAGDISECKNNKKIGYVVADGEKLYITCSYSGAVIQGHTSDSSISFEGLRNAGSSATLTNGNHKTISKIVIFDIAQSNE